MHEPGVLTLRSGGRAQAGRVIDSFEDPTRRFPYCCVMDGWQETLFEYLDQRAGRLARNEAKYIAEQLLRCLAKLHALGVVHTLVTERLLAYSCSRDYPHGLQL